MSLTSPENLPADITVRNKLKPGDVGYLLYLHGVLYAEEFGWDSTFEGYVAGPLGEFAKSQSDRERIWIVEKGAIVAGSIAIVDAGNQQAQLRWFLLHPDLRGLGIGKKLVQEAVSFCIDRDYSSIFLSTGSALVAAAKLYLSAGFKLTEEITHPMWGSLVTEQRYELSLR